jgi:hypothetical protein
LLGKYEELKAEIDDKTKQMADQLADKKNTASNI